MPHRLPLKLEPPVELGVGAGWEGLRITERAMEIMVTAVIFTEMAHGPDGHLPAKRDPVLKGSCRQLQTSSSREFPRDKEEVKKREFYLVWRSYLSKTNYRSVLHVWLRGGRRFMLICFSFSSLKDTVLIYAQAEAQVIFLLPVGAVPSGPIQALVILKELDEQMKNVQV